MSDCKGRCGSVGTIVARAARILNDTSYVRWSKADLVDYLNEALCEMHGLRPDAFARSVDLPLRAGSLQSLPPGYSALVEIVSNLATVGTDIVEGTAVSEADARYAALARKKPCLASSICAADPSQATISSFSRDAIDPTQFTVYPPVPVGAGISVRATVIVRPLPFVATDWDACTGIECLFDAQLVNWIVYRAFSTDSESQTATNTSDKFIKAFYDAFQADYLQLQRFTSGQYAGMDIKRPGADPNFRQK